MILNNPQDHPEDNLPSKKCLEKLFELGIDPAIFFGQDHDQRRSPRIHHSKLHHVDYHDNIFSRQGKRPRAMTVTVNPRVVLLRFNNLCLRPYTCQSEPLFLAEIILEYKHCKDWVICLN